MRTLTLDQVAVVLQLTPRTVYNYLRTGKLPGIKLCGRQWRVLEEDLKEFIHTGVNLKASRR